MTTVQIFRGTVNGWQPAGSGRAVSADRAAHLLSLLQRINGQEWLYRIAPAPAPRFTVSSADLATLA
jgi:hypothetical protein